MYRLIATVSLICALPLVLAQPLDKKDQQRWLQGQIRLGEALFRDDLVQDALTRLRLLEPESPQLLAAAARLALRKRDVEQASRLLSDLDRLAPNSPYTSQVRRLLTLNEPEGQKALQQIRLLAVAGRNEEAWKQFEQLFAGEPPSLELALEYWRVRSKLEGQRALTITKLQELEQKYPGSIPLRQLLADLLFAENRNTEALALLHLMSRDSNARDLAAQREFSYLAAQPVSQSSVAAWSAFLERYAGSNLAKDAEEVVAGQRALVADPGWQAGQKGKRLLDGNRDAKEAERLLRQALKRYPEDSSLKGYLGISLLRQGRRGEALRQFQEAERAEQDPYSISKWHDLVLSTRYWLLLQRADQALQKQQLEQARGLYMQAHRQQPQDIFALLGLADVAVAFAESDSAEALFQQVRRLEPGNESATRGLLRIYQAQSSERALAYLDSLPADMRGIFSELRRSLLMEKLLAQEELAQKEKNWPEVSRLLLGAVELDPDDPWLTYRLASSLVEQERFSEADDAFARLLSRRGVDPVARYAHALYLESGGRYAGGLSSLEKLPETFWTAEMQILALRLQRHLLVGRVTALRNAGREDHAVQLLESNIAQTDAETARENLHILAGWAQERGDPSAARGYYERILASDADNDTALLGLIESRIAEGDLTQAHNALLSRPPRLDAASIDARRRLASTWAAVGERRRATDILNRLTSLQNQPDPLLHRDLARLQSLDQPDLALDRFALAMADAGLIDGRPGEPRDDIAMTRASRARDGDDWLERSLRSDVDHLYQRRNPSVTLQQDYGWRDNDSTPGVSDLGMATTILQIELPVLHGRGFLRAERVSMDAGSFDLDADGLHREDFGSCQFSGSDASGSIGNGCRGGSQKSDGTTVALGWSDERLSADLGLAPQGFEVSNILGGATWSDSWNTLGWSLTASRRPMTNSLLSYAGAVDPRTGETWGGVTANGLTLGLSHDQGGAHGVWANLGQHWLRGENVADNQRFSAMTGYYYRLIDRADERLRVGSSLMYWRYEKDLGGYSLGQGGYYSPQRYISLGLPVNYAWRDADWSVALEGALGYSWAKSDERKVYPLDSLNRKWLSRYQITDSNIDAVSDGDSSSGLGVRLQALLERRLSDHLVLGGGFTWQHSEDYAPSRASLYIRYLFEPWQGNLPLPVQPLIPYGDFR